MRYAGWSPRVSATGSGDNEQRPDNGSRTSGRKARVRMLAKKIELNSLPAMPSSVAKATALVVDLIADSDVQSIRSIISYHDSAL